MIDHRQDHLFIYSRDLTTFIISYISLKEIISFVPDPNSVADVDPVNPKGCKTLLAKGMECIVH